MSDINVVRSQSSNHALYWQLVDKLGREDANPDTLIALIGMGISELEEEVDDEPADWSTLQVKVDRTVLAITLRAPQR